MWHFPIHTALRLRKICAICRAKGAICGTPITPNGICANLWDLWEIRSTPNGFSFGANLSMGACGQGVILNGNRFYL